MSNFIDRLEFLLTYLVEEELAGNRLMICVQNLESLRQLLGVWWVPEAGRFRLGRSVGNPSMGLLYHREALVQELRREALKADQQLGVCSHSSKGFRPKFSPPTYASPF